MASLHNNILFILLIPLVLLFSLQVTDGRMVVKEDDLRPTSNREQQIRNLKEQQNLTSKPPEKTNERLKFGAKWEDKRQAEELRASLFEEFMLDERFIQLEASAARRGDRITDIVSTFFGTVTNTFMNEMQNELHQIEEAGGANVDSMFQRMVRSTEQYINHGKTIESPPMIDAALAFQHYCELKEKEIATELLDELKIGGEYLT